VDVDADATPPPAHSPVQHDLEATAERKAVDSSDDGLLPEPPTDPRKACVRVDAQPRLFARSAWVTLSCSFIALALCSSD